MGERDGLGAIQLTSAFYKQVRMRWITHLKYVVTAITRNPGLRQIFILAAIRPKCVIRWRGVQQRGLQRSFSAIAKKHLAGHGAPLPLTQYPTD